MAKSGLKWFYNSEAWKAKRLQALTRDGFTCQICGARAEEVHHIIELNADNVRDFKVSLSLENLQSLCGACHKRITALNQKKVEYIDDGFFFDESGNIERIEPPR